MPSRPVPSDKPVAIKSVESTTCDRKISEMLRKIDCMIDWWTTNQSGINTDPDVVAKCDRIILQLKNYRKCVQDKFVEYERMMVRAKELYRSGSGDEFQNAESRVNETCRELERMQEDAGHYFQALITRWFHEDDIFTITDVEVRGNGYDFDVEIADERGNRYCVEVWQGYSKLHHAMRENTSILGVYYGRVHHDRGSVPDRLADVASNKGGISTDPKHDLPKILSKLKQLPDDRVGFLVACRCGDDFPEDLRSDDFPEDLRDRMLDNKCIIVLNFGGGPAHSLDATSRSLIYSPSFEHAEVAKKIFQSLWLKYKQEA